MFGMWLRILNNAFKTVQIKVLSGGAAQLAMGTLKNLRKYGWAFCTISLTGIYGKIVIYSKSDSIKN